MSVDVKVEIPTGIESAKLILQEEVITAVRDSGLSMEREAKRQAPVDTGHLRRSVTSHVTPLSSKPTAIVAASARYAPYVEYGTGVYAKDGNGRQTPWVYKTRKGQFIWTRGNKPNPFMGRAFTIKKDSAVKRVNGAIKRALERMKQ